MRLALGRCMKNAPLAAMLVVGLTLTSSCATYRDSRMAARIGGYFMASGATVVAVAGVIHLENPSPASMADSPIGVAIIGAMIFTLGGLIGGPGLVGMGIYDKPLSAEARGARAQAVRDAQARDAQAARGAQAPGAAVDAKRRDVHGR